MIRKINIYSKLKVARAELIKVKEEMATFSEGECYEKEVERVEIHMKKVYNERVKRHENKLPADDTPNDIDENGNIFVDDENLPEGWNVIFVESSRNKRRRRFNTSSLSQREPGRESQNHPTQKKAICRVDGMELSRTYPVNQFQKLKRVCF